jgi:hypothetical protein
MPHDITSRGSILINDMLADHNQNMANKKTKKKFYDPTYI